MHGLAHQHHHRPQNQLCGRGSVRGPTRRRLGTRRLRGSDGWRLSHRSSRELEGRISTIEMLERPTVCESKMEDSSPGGLDWNLETESRSAARTSARANFRRAWHAQSDHKTMIDILLHLSALVSRHNGQSRNIRFVFM
ncbi:hypothetical protein Mapa_010942 [Marchantia paleacea]|nr:hypothetical protein Mapa_010942 [Marchantia paleacea]